MFTMTDFARLIAEWRTFYATVATACATLTGLLFVAVSLNADTIRSDPGGEAMRVARQTFGSFISVLMIALVFLVPFDTPLGLAAALIALGVVGIGGITRTLLEGRRTGGIPRRMWPEIVLAIVAHSSLIVVSVLLINNITLSLYGLVAIMAALLVRASRNAWYFLILVQTKQEGIHDRGQVRHPAVKRKN